MLTPDEWRTIAADLVRLELEERRKARGSRQYVGTVHAVAAFIAEATGAAKDDALEVVYGAIPEARRVADAAIDPATDPRGSALRHAWAVELGARLAYLEREGVPA